MFTLTRNHNNTLGVVKIRPNLEEFLQKFGDVKKGEGETIKSLRFMSIQFTLFTVFWQFSLTVYKQNQKLTDLLSLLRHR